MDTIVYMILTYVMLTIIGQEIIEFELLVFELCPFLQKSPKIKFSNRSLHSKQIITATVLSVSHIHCKSHLNSQLITDLSITYTLHWKGTEVRHFIQMGTQCDCLDQIQKIKILLKAN